MAKYRCHNSKCKECSKDVTANTHIIYKSTGPVDEGAPCPKCGEIREMVDDGISTTFLAKGNLNLNRK